MAERLLHHLEPRLMEILNETLTSDMGKQMISDVLSDVMVDLLLAPSKTDSGDNNWLEETLVRVVERLAETRPDFQSRILAVLSRPSSDFPQPG